MTAIDAMHALDHDERAQRATQAVNNLRHADSLLTRRRRLIGDLSTTDRAALRFVQAGCVEGLGVSPSDLAHHLGISSASVTVMLDRLMALGRIEVAPHDTDRRRKVITVTPQEHSGADVIVEAVRAATADLSTAEAELVARFLDQVTNAVMRESENLTAQAR